MQAIYDRVEENANRVEVCMEVLAEIIPVNAVTRSEYLVNVALFVADPENERLQEFNKRVSCGLDGICQDIVGYLNPGITRRVLAERTLDLRLHLDGLAWRLIENENFTADQAMLRLKNQLLSLETTNPH